MSSYEALASCYDEFTTDVHYAQWADYITGLFSKYGSDIKEVLDLACGTGSLSVELAKRGFEVVGTDMSEEMLSVAMQKVWDIDGPRPMFLHQDMEHLDLYGTVDAAVCSLDSLNYLTTLKALRDTFGRLKFFIRPGGLFIFDLNTDAKFKALDGRVFLRENDGYFCTWSAEYDEDSRLSTFCYDIFTAKGELWSRNQELHTERAHSNDEIKSALEDAEFELLASFGELSDTAPKADEQRVFYVAKRK